MMYWYFDPCRKQHPHRSSHKSQKTADRTYLDELQGKNVKINRGGPNSIEGRLVSVESDYLVVRTSEGTTYVKTSHIKSITDLDQSSSGGSTGGRSAGRSAGRSPGNRTGKKTGFIKAANFKGVLSALNKKFVQVNWGGPEKVEGFLADVGSTHILVVSAHQKVDIPIDHIQAVKVEARRTSGGSGGSAGSGDSADAKGNNKTATRRGAAPVNKGTALKRRSGR